MRPMSQMKMGQNRPHLELRPHHRMNGDCDFNMIYCAALAVSVVEFGCG